MDTAGAILITGGAGFIGNHVVRLFVNKYPGTRIINLDKLTYAGNLENLKDIEDRPNYTFVRADICDYEAVKAIITRTDHDPDVIGFQECSTNPIKSSMPTLLANAYTFHVSADSNCDPALIAWKKDKYTLVEGGITDMLQTNLEYTAATKKSNLAHWVRLKEKAGGREFLLYNIHVKTNSSSVSYQKLRYDCIQGLLEAAAFRSKHAGDIPVLIVGDFNNYLQTVEEGCISAPAACLAGGYADAASAAATRKNFQYKTYVTDVDEGVVSTWSSKDSRLDYIFVWSSKGAAVESYQTVIDFIPGSTTRINTPVPSDHCPVNAVIKFN